MNTIAVYPAGTHLGDIKYFDRSQKVYFHCPQHPSTTWMSKDPHVSHWFPNVPIGTVYEVCQEAACDEPLSNWVVAREYRPSRNG